MLGFGQSGLEEEVVYDEHDTYSAWEEGAILLGRRNKEQVAAWIDEVDSLLTFVSSQS